MTNESVHAGTAVNAVCPPGRRCDDGHEKPAQPPLANQQVTSPVRVSGTADVFEAVVSLRVLDSAGNELARTFTNAACGTGGRGVFAVTISYSVAQSQPGTIEVFEVSAKDGSPVNMQLIPVTLNP